MNYDEIEKLKVLIEKALTPKTIYGIRYIDDGEAWWGLTEEAAVRIVERNKHRSENFHCEVISKIDDSEPLITVNANHLKELLEYFTDNHLFFAA